MQLITKEELADLIFENKESMYRLAYTIYEEFSVGEISRMLKIPTGTVKSRLARGRDKLSTIL